MQSFLNCLTRNGNENDFLRMIIIFSFHHFSGTLNQHDDLFWEWHPFWLAMMTLDLPSWQGQTPIVAVSATPSSPFPARGKPQQQQPLTMIDLTDSVKQVILGPVLPFSGIVVEVDITFNLRFTRTTSVPVRIQQVIAVRPAERTLRLWHTIQKHDEPFAQIFEGLEILLKCVENPALCHWYGIDVFCFE